MLFNHIETANTTLQREDAVNEVNCAQYCLLGLQEANLDWFNVTKKTMFLESKSLKEENSTLLNLSITDFFQKIIEILQRMRENLLSFWNKFKTYVHQYDHRNSKLFKKYEGILLQKNMVGFKALAPKFTIKENVPNLNAKDSFLKDFTKDKILNITQADVIKVQSEHETFADKFRGQVLNRQHIIQKEDFIRELYLEFRGGTEDEVYVKLPSGTAKTTFLNRIATCQKDISILEQQKVQITNFYDTVIAYFKSFVQVVEQEGNRIVQVRTQQGSRMTVSSDKYDLLTTYGDYKSRMCKSALSIYNLAFSMKLDAFKERNRRFKEILVEALNYRNDGDPYSQSIFDEI